MVDPLTFLIWAVIGLLFAPLLLAVAAVTAGFVLLVLALTFIFILLILGVLSVPAGTIYLRWYDWSSLRKYKSTLKTMTKTEVSA